MIVLSLFSGIGLLDMGFEAAGFTVLRGPDLLWGSDIKKFDGSPLRGKIAGVIAGVPCQRFSTATLKKNKGNHADLWPYLGRVVRECDPAWYLAECVPPAASAAIDMFNTAYVSHKPTSRILDCSSLGSAQARRRLIVYGDNQPSAFWDEVESHGKIYGGQWRQKIGRDALECARYRTIHGDSLEARNSGKTNPAPARFIKEGDDLLDAFDLPADWSMPKHGRFSRGTIARLLSQGVPVAAAYALAVCVRAARTNLKPAS